MVHLGFTAKIGGLSYQLFSERDRHHAVFLVWTHFGNSS